MTKEEIIRNLKYTMKKHKNDIVNTFDTNISVMCKDILNYLEQEPYDKCCDKCEVGNPCLYCKHKFEPQENEKEDKEKQMRTYTVTEYEEEDYEHARNMGISDVIARLGWIKRGYLPDYSCDHNGTEENYERFANQMAMSRAIELLKEYKVSLTNDN